MHCHSIARELFLRQEWEGTTESVDNVDGWFLTRTKKAIVKHLGSISNDLTFD